MVSYLLILIGLSAFVSAWTLGLRTISNEGMVLFPIRRWCLSKNKTKKQKISNLLQRCKMQLNKAATKGDRATAENVQARIDRLKWIDFKINAWHKPLITCAPCMSSFHGLLTSIYLAIIVGWEILLICPFSIMLSVVINVLLWKKIKNGL